ncbi:MAG: HAMP domain-containing sensor histidine kinase [Polyangiaceae bacterium]
MSAARSREIPLKWIQYRSLSAVGDESVPKLSRVEDCATTHSGIFTVRPETRGQGSRAEGREGPSESATYAVHDAKNLTCALAASIEWLRGQLPGAELQGVVADMANTCAELTELLSRELSESRAGRQSLSLQREPVLVSDLVRQAVRHYRARAALSGVKVTVEAGYDAVIHADRVLYTRVVENLLDNALRAAPPDSEVTVFYGRLGERVVLSVSDEGPGIPEPARQEIFDLFVGSAPQPQHGFGVGLAFCRRIVEAHGGELTLTESPSGGATFIAKIPAVER